MIRVRSTQSVRRQGTGKKLAMYFAMALLAGAPRLFAQPAITAVENAASNLDPRLPNAGIAQGAIFVVYGTSLGPANIAVAPAAFQSTTLSNTSVAVTVGGTTVDAPLYYTSAGQVAALLPSNTPTGPGTITVTYNNQASAKAPIRVVANNLAFSASIPPAPDLGSSPTPTTAWYRHPKRPTAEDRIPPAARPIRAIRSSSGARDWAPSAAAMLPAQASA
jgi:hypothetical protein